MIGSWLLYGGVVLALVGTVRIWWRPRRRGVLILTLGVFLASSAVVLPAPESRVAVARSRLDDFAPVWQFREFHSRRIEAPPAPVFEALRGVRADEIALFQTLTWIRRGGRELPAGILNAGDAEPLLDVATRSGFVRLAEEAPRELVIGAAIVPGQVVATMNFLVEPDGAGGSLVSTETRVHASNPAARRRFAAYWRAIYPGSALIRRMWLRAIARRAETP